jgi:hypothetical protein
VIQAHLNSHVTFRSRPDENAGVGGPIGPSLNNQVKIVEGLIRNEIRSKSLKVVPADDHAAFDGPFSRGWVRLGPSARVPSPQGDTVEQGPISFFVVGSLALNEARNAARQQASQKESAPSGPAGVTDRRSLIPHNRLPAYKWDAMGSPLILQDTARYETLFNS